MDKETKDLKKTEKGADENQKEVETKNIKEISPLLNQVCLNKLGMYCSERLSIDLYYLVEVLDILISNYGEEDLEKDYPGYLEVKRKKDKLNKLLAKSKTFYDTLQDKNLSFKDKFKGLPLFQTFLNNQFIKVSSKISPIQLDIYKLFVFLIKNSSLQKQTIRSEMFKVLEYRDNVKINTKPGEKK